MNTRPQPPLVVWWVIWLSMLTGVFVCYFVLAAQNPHGATSEAGSILWMTGGIPLVASVLLRVFVLPRIAVAAAALPLFVMGLALAESTTFMGVFLFPSHKLELFSASALGIAGYVPFFVVRFYK